MDCQTFAASSNQPVMRYSYRIPTSRTPCDALVSHVLHHDRDVDGFSDSVRITERGALPVIDYETALDQLSKALLS